MLDVHIAPLTGALIVSNSVWNRIAPEDRVKVTAAAEVFEKRMRAEIPEQDATSVTTMVKSGGLTVIIPDAKAAAEFRIAAGQLVASMRGSTAPADVFDMAVQARDAFRKTRAR
jgi:TRAP-type C4-dicarboxylate transport system substrate-binding protein